MILNSKLLLLEVGSGSHVGHSRLHANIEVLYSDIQVTGFNRKWLTVCCDGQFLPFKTCSIDMVYSRLAIEYAKDSILFFTELLRVAKKQVTVICCHRLSRIKKPKDVKHEFSPKWFRVLLTNFDHEVNVEYGWLRINTNMPIPFLMTSGFIVVKVWK